MRRTNVSSLPLVVLLTTLSASAAAETDPAIDLGAAYAQACDDNGTVCVSDLQVTAAAALAPQADRASATINGFAAATDSYASAGASTFSGLLASPLVRRTLVGDVVEYYVDVRVGPGTYDHIGLHRVVRENAPYLPKYASKSVMLVHGDVWNFQAAFLANGGAPADSAVAVYLAQQGIDVWGIDLGWTMVPAEETNLSFMANWGFARDTRDIGLALGIARATRLLTGQGYGKMNLLGWSRGGQLSYAYLDGESQIASALRHVSGFIPVDIYLKTNVAQQRLDACSRLATANASLGSGVYANDTGKSFAPLGTLAIVAPTAVTPVPAFQPMSNDAVAKLVGAATYLIAAPPPVPSYHFAGGAWDTSGQLTGLAYEDASRWYDFVAKGSPYQPWRQIADAEIAMCNDPSVGNVPFDDHLSSITVPVLYVGAGGGFGNDGVYTTTLLGSTDVTTHVVQLYPSAYRMMDVGHGDIFQGTSAQSQFWGTIKDWIVAH